MTRAALGLSPDATPDEVRRRYKELAQRLHPDKGGTTADFQRLQSDYRAALSEEAGTVPPVPVWETCTECDGKGYLLMGSGFTMMRMPCFACDGEGRLRKNK